GRLGRGGGGDLLAVLVEHGPDPPEGGAGGHYVPDVQGAPAHEDGRHRAAALVQVGLDDRALGAPVRVGLEVQLHVGDQQDGLDQGVEALLGLGRHVDELGLAAVLLGDQVVLAELLAGPGLGCVPIRAPAPFAWLPASTVLGMSPSSAATTSTATSVTAAPLPRMAVNASWPGV